MPIVTPIPAGGTQPIPRIVTSLISWGTQVDDAGGSSLITQFQVRTKIICPASVKAPTAPVIPC
jgi:hypothetical protein